MVLSGAMDAIVSLDRNDSAKGEWVGSMTQTPDVLNLFLGESGDFG